MTTGLFRVRLPSGDVRLARGAVEHGPSELLPGSRSVAALLGAGGEAVADAAREPAVASVPDGTTVLAPVDAQEVWAAGVTYERSRSARIEEAVEPSVYDRVYEAARPELFFKAPGWRVRGPGDPVGIRADSGWDVPEPELAIVADRDLRLVGYTIGNDVSSRAIEGENPLYLPQAKLYTGSCSLGPAIVPAFLVDPPFEIHLTVIRAGRTIVDESTSSDRLHRAVEDLLHWLGRALEFPDGVVLLTGTGIVPPPDFSLQPGDVVTVAIDGLGELTNPVERVGQVPAERP